MSKPQHMSKFELMQAVEKILKDWKLESGRDYIFSLQGPTIILSMSGQEKMNQKRREEVEELGMVILG